MKINNRLKQGAIIIDISGDLDESNADKTFKLIHDNIFENDDILRHKNTILNLSWLNYLNSKSIWYMAYLFWAIEELWGNLYISNYIEKIKDSLELAGIGNIIQIFDDENDVLLEIENNK